MSIVASVLYANTAGCEPARASRRANLRRATLVHSQDTQIPLIRLNNQSQTQTDSIVPKTFSRGGSGILKFRRTLNIFDRRRRRQLHWDYSSCTIPLKRFVTLGIPLCGYPVYLLTSQSLRNCDRMKLSVPVVAGAP